jgi:nicotinamide N-methyltransferase
LPDGAIVKCFTRDKNRRFKETVQDKLFVDDVWPGSRVLADYLVRDPQLVMGKVVLELGAGAALPSCVAAKLGAAHVLVTDFPGDEVLDNIERVLECNQIVSATVTGHVWGRNVECLVQLTAKYGRDKFDTILIAEPLWKDTYKFHRDLLTSIKACLSKKEGSVALLAFAHRTTEEHTKERDLEFFAVAQAEFQLSCSKVFESCEYCDVDELEPTNVFVYSIIHQCEA